MKAPSEFYPYDDLSDIAEPDTAQIDLPDEGWDGSIIDIDSREATLGAGVLTAGGNYARILDTE